MSVNDLAFEAGDKVYHKSNSSVIWVVEEIRGDELICSTLSKDSNTQSKETFKKVVVSKVSNTGGNTIGFGKHSNPYRF